MRGVRTGYLVFPLPPTIVGASVTFAQAAKEAGLDLIVNISQLSPKLRAMPFDKLFNGFTTSCAGRSRYKKFLF
jgi:hypothetical protein